MTLRRPVLLLSLAVVTGLAVGLWLLRPHTAITRENSAKIQNGTTLRAVEALLGGPERIDTTGPTQGDAESDADGLDGEHDATERFTTALAHLRRCHRTHIGSVKRTWGSDEVAIFVAFDADERVIACAVRPLRRAPESVFDMLQRWLGL